MKCIVSGFDRFGQYAYNPTEEIVKALPSELKTANGHSARLERLVLGTCCQEAWDKLEHALDLESKEDTFLLLTGFAANENLIRLERFALNIREYRLADNNQHQWLDEYIDPNQVDALRTQVPVKTLAGHLQSLGYACKTSNDCGSFVCNETYFRALGKLANEKRRKQAALFVHLPAPENYGLEKTESSAEWPMQAPETCQKNLLVLQKAIEEIIVWSAAWLKAL